MILHRQLQALLHRLGVDEGQPPDEDRWLALLVLLNDRFRQFEEDRHRLQRSLDIHSREVQSLYKELTQERDKVSSALACLDSALILLDGQGRPLLMSAEADRRLGYSEQEVEGKDLFALLGLNSILPEGGLTALLSGLRPYESVVAVKTRHGVDEMFIKLQPLIRERQLIGCLLQLSDPAYEDEDLEFATVEDMPAVEVDEPELVEAFVETAPPPREVAAAAPVVQEIVEEPQVEAPPAKPAVAPLRILLVESDAAAAADGRAHLEELGQVCRHTGDGLEALRLYHEEHFDAILCCEEPLGLSGVELCKRLRQDSRGGYPYFILMTPAGARAQATRALEAGVDAFLNKPLEAVELQVRLKVARGVQSRLNSSYSKLMGPKDS